MTDEVVRPVLSVSADVAWVRDGPHVLLLALQDGARRLLTATGADVWQHVVSTGDLDQVTSALRAQYPDAPAGLRDDVEALIDELVLQGFLRRSS